MKRFFRGAAVVMAASVLGGCSLFTRPAPSVAPVAAPVPASVEPSPTASASVTAAPPTAAAPRAWDELTQQFADSIVAITLTDCAGDRSSGTGFVVGDDLVMTAAHVVENADRVELVLPARRSSGGSRPDGYVLGVDIVNLDAATDSALLRTRVPIGRQAMSLLTSEPAQASDLLVMGYPYFTTRLFTSPGILGGYRESITLGDQKVGPILVTSAAANPGNSGGPAIDRWGNVIGLVTARQDFTPTGRPAEGANFLIPSTTLADNLASWEDMGTLAGGCDPISMEQDYDFDWLVELPEEEPARSAGAFIAQHGNSINEGDYYAAWVMMTREMQQRMGGLDRWTSGVESSFWRELYVDEVSQSGGLWTVRVRLMTEQDAEAGHSEQTCSMWDLTYSLIENEEGTWNMDRASGDSPEPCAG